MSRNGKYGAAFIAFVAGVTLITRLALRIEQSNGLLDAVSYMSQYFTILTNAIVFLMMLAIATGKLVRPVIVRTVVIAIACVGLLYHSLLAHLVSLSGLDLLADHGTHTFEPILSVIWWLLWAENPKVRRTDPLLWVAWPLLYTAYILVRASFSGFYPYPFLNFPVLGTTALLINVLVISTGFVIVGFVLSGVGRLIHARHD